MRYKTYTFTAVLTGATYKAMNAAAHMVSAGCSSGYPSYSVRLHWSCSCRHNLLDPEGIWYADFLPMRSPTRRGGVGIYRLRVM